MTRNRSKKEYASEVKAYWDAKEAEKPTGNLRPDREVTDYLEEEFSRLFPGENIEAKATLRNEGYRVKVDSKIYDMAYGKPGMMTFKEKGSGQILTFKPWKKWPN